MNTVVRNKHGDPCSNPERGIFNHANSPGKVVNPTILLPLIGK